MSHSDCWRSSDIQQPKEVSVLRQRRAVNNRVCELATDLFWTEKCETDTPRPLNPRGRQDVPAWGNALPHPGLEEFCWIWCCSPPLNDRLNMGGTHLEPPPPSPQICKCFNKLCVAMLLLSFFTWSGRNYTKGINYIHFLEFQEGVCAF